MEGGEIPGARTLVHTGGRQRLTNRTDKTRPLFDLAFHLDDFGLAWTVEANEWEWNASGSRYLQPLYWLIGLKVWVRKPRGRPYVYLTLTIAVDLEVRAETRILDQFNR